MAELYLGNATASFIYPSCAYICYL